MKRLNNWYVGDALPLKCARALEQLYLCSVSTVKQLRRDAFDNCSLTFAYRKMREFERAGFVERVYFNNQGRHTMAYTLTMKGFREFILEEESEKPLAKKFRPQSLLHELALVDIRHAFGQLSVVKNYYTENLILSGSDHFDSEKLKKAILLRPDAIVELVREGKSYFFAIEYEASLKYSGHIKRKMNNYYDCRDLTGVIFITKGRPIQKSLLAIEEQGNARFNPKIFYATLDEVLGASSKLEFAGRRNAKLAIA